MKAGCSLVIHWTNKLPDGMCYVMLGRSERLQDIFIICKDEEMDMQAIRCDPSALAESERLENIFDLAEQQTKSIRNTHWKISFLNVRSLNAHHHDVLNDNIITDSDIIGLGETWLHHGEERNLEGFFGYFSNFGKGKGLAGYSKMTLLAKTAISSSSYSAMHFIVKEFDVIFLYLSKDYEKESLFNLIESWIDENTPTAVIGDINENLYEHSNFEKFMRTKSFQQMMKRPTFEKGSILDHIYVNKLMMEKNPFTEQPSCYYSDHDLISLYISK